ncbi:MAG TPA: peroxiredoxin [bacterium]|nr:peroxiredoxin [bacterium]
MKIKYYYPVFLLSLAAYLLIAVSLTAADTHTLEIGDQAPSFYANDDNGDLWKLEDYLAKKYVIIYFYPAAMTGGCTKQACSYRDNKAELLDLDIEVVGVSGDPVNNLKLFKQVHNLNFSLLSDTGGDIAKIFGVPVRDGGTINKTVGGQVFSLKRSFTEARWTFIIGKDGKIIYKDTEVNAEKDSNNVIKFLKAKVR